MWVPHVVACGGAGFRGADAPKGLPAVTRCFAIVLPRERSPVASG